MKPIPPMPTGRPITITREGDIPALEVTAEGKKYWLVVKLRNPSRDSMPSGALRLPQRDDLGRLVYAVPGGGSYVAG